MKARSVVFTHTQAPFTIFGLPPRMMGLSVATATVVFVIMVAAGAVAFSVIGLIFTLVLCLSVSVRIARTDRHVESLFLANLAFWRGRPERFLVAGDFSGRKDRQ